MNIRNTTMSDLEALARYQIKTFPERGKQFPFGYMRFWFSKSERDPNLSLVVVDDEDNIHGQDIFSSMSLYWLGERQDSVWGFDYIVDEELRSDAWGVDILLAQKELYKTVYSTGANDFALKLNLKAGMRWMGRLRKYVKMVNPFFLPVGFFKGMVAKGKFPPEVELNGVLFDKVEADGYPDLSQPFNPGLLEFGRDMDFLKWRYGQLHEYVFYRQRGSDNYFVVRTIVKGHITALVIVDFRCELNDSSQYLTIVKAATQIAKKLHLPVLITGSSLAVTDAVLEGEGFRSVGRPRPIIGNDKRLKHHEAEVEARNFTLVTLADSDGEVGW